MIGLALLACLASPSLAQDVPARGGQPCDEGTAIATGTCLSAEGLVDGFANLRGGLRRGVAGLGQVKLGLGVDLGAAAGLDGWSFQASAFGIFGRQPTPTLVGNLAPLSNAEALSTFRLSELWLERGFEGVGSIRFGQLTGDTEFMAADAADGLMNGTFGWPLALSTALPSGGPAYPFAAPGIRLALGDPDKGSGVRLALFSGDPGGRVPAGTDPQRHNRYGTNFSFAGGALYMAEGVVGAPAPEAGEPRPWVGKLGGWYHTGGFDDQRGDATTLPRHPNNYGGYAIGEVTLWREGMSSLAAFARASATPSNRNLLGFYADGGFAWRAPFGRAADTASIGIAYARTGKEGRAADRAAQQFDSAIPVRDREMVLEANYEFGLVPDHLFIRPGVQWISHPGAGIPDERYSSDTRLRNAVVLGLRLRAVL
jgi:porin